MALIIEGNLPKSCYDCKFAEMRYASDRECRCGLLGYGVYMDISRGAEIERNPACPIIGEIPDEHGELGRTVVIGRAGARAIRELYERIEKAPAVVEAST